MNKSTLLFIVTGIASIVSLAINSKKRNERSPHGGWGPEIEPANHPAAEFFENNGFRVSQSDGPDGFQVLRLRGSWEDIRRLANPHAIEQKPPVPEDLDIDSLPKYDCGCPHCRAMSIYGENQWRYQELSRTRGPWDNTTTYLTMCKKCGGFMKATVDHDD